MPFAVETLSVREAQVALKVADCCTVREIADQLGLGYETINSYVDRLREKTGLRRKAQLAIWAAAHRKRLSRRIKKG